MYNEDSKNIKRDLEKWRGTDNVASIIMTVQTAIVFNWERKRIKNGKEIACWCFRCHRYGWTEIRISS